MIKTEINPLDQSTILTKSILDKILQQDKPSDLIAVLTFYQYTSRWQKTDQPKCTVRYIANGLKISPERVRKARKVLLELGLIEDVVNKRKDGKIEGRYVKLFYLFHTTDFHSKETQSKMLIYNNKEMLNSISKSKDLEITGNEKSAIADSRFRDSNIDKKNSSYNNKSSYDENSSYENKSYNNSSYSDNSSTLKKESLISRKRKLLSMKEKSSILKKKNLPIEKEKYDLTPISIETQTKSKGRPLLFAGYSKKVKRVIAYWNRLENVQKVRINENNKTFTYSRKIISKMLEKHSYDEIIKSMKAYDEFLGYMKKYCPRLYNLKSSMLRVSLKSYFKMSKNELSYIRNGNYKWSKIKSWFEESLNGLSHLMSLYSVGVAPKHDLTYRLVRCHWWKRVKFPQLPSEKRSKVMLQRNSSDGILSYEPWVEFDNIEEQMIIRASNQLYDKLRAHPKLSSYLKTKDSLRKIISDIVYYLFEEEYKLDVDKYRKLPTPYYLSSHMVLDTVALRECGVLGLGLG